jgi:hypothetical protein
MFRAFAVTYFVAISPVPRRTLLLSVSKRGRVLQTEGSSSVSCLSYPSQVAPVEELVKWPKLSKYRCFAKLKISLFNSSGEFVPSFMIL